MSIESGTAHLPLAGKTIVVTRRKEQAKEFSDMLERSGARVLLFPAVEIVEPVSWTECDSAIERLNEYSGIIFTSTNAVEYFFRRVRHRTELEQVKTCAFYAVGEKTKSVIEGFGFQTEKLPETFSAEQLTKMMARGEIAGKKFLFPKGNLAKDEIVTTLASHGAVVDDVIVYNTQEPSFTAERQRLLQEIEQRADLITFFSPSSVNHSMNQARKIFISKNVAVIGETTAAAARDEKLNVVIVAPRSTVTTFVQEIEKFYSNK